MNENEYININKVAEAKGLKSNRSLRLEINKPESKYIDLYIIADIIGLDNTIRIMEHFNYLTFNIPKNVSYPYKKQYILDNYDGTRESRFHIRKACNVCDSYIYSVMREKKEKREK